MDYYDTESGKFTIVRTLYEFDDPNMKNSEPKVLEKTTMEFLSYKSAFDQYKEMYEMDDAAYDTLKTYYGWNFVNKFDESDNHQGYSFKVGNKQLIVTLVEQLRVAHSVFGFADGEAP